MNLQGKKKEIITPEQMSLLDSLIPQMKTLRYADGHLDPIFHETNTEHILSMLKQAISFIQNHKMERHLSQYHTDAVIKAHDLPEMGMEKDFTVWEIQKNPNLAFDKEAHEMRMVEMLREQYGDWLANLCLEYMANQTNDAKFVKWLDKYNATQHILEKQEIKPFSHPDWLVNGIDRLIKVANAKFLIPPTLQVMEERKPLFKKHNLLDVFHAKEKDLLVR